MLSKEIPERESKQEDLFRVMLRDVVDPKHPLVISIPAYIYYK